MRGPLRSYKVSAAAAAKGTVCTLKPFAPARHVSRPRAMSRQPTGFDASNTNRRTCSGISPAEQMGRVGICRKPPIADSRGDSAQVFDPLRSAMDPSQVFDI